MQNKPEGWPSAGPVEQVPNIYLRMGYSAWPPAGEETPAGVAMVGDWSVDRELTGANLPGQVRGPSGFSVATGSVTFPQPAGAPLSPWARGNLQLGPGGVCALYATHEAGEQLNLGKFLVAPIQGSNISGTVNLDLEDQSIQIKRPYTLNWQYDPLMPSMDAAWVICQVARTNGYHATPVAPSSIVFDAPLTGSAKLDTGTLTSVPSIAWDSAGGMIGMGNVSRIWGRFSGVNGWDKELGISAQVVGRGGMIIVAGLVVDIRDNYVLIRNESGGELGRFELDAKTTVIRQVMVSLDRKGTTSLGVKVGTPGVGWSAQVTYTTADTLPTDLNDLPIVVSTYGYGGGANTGRWINGVQVWEHNGSWIPDAHQITAYVEPTQSPLTGVFGIQEQNSWTVLQDIAAATLGAVWVDENGCLTYRNRTGLRQSAFTEDIEALDKVEELAWSIDPADVADRVEFSFTPADIFTGGDIITIWEASSRIRVGAGLTITLRLEIPGSTDRVSSFLPAWDTTQDGNRYSRWMASTLIDGSGERPADDALKFSWNIVGGSVIELTITNTTDEGLWLVDGSGDPYLILRTSRYVTPGETRTISSGASVASAVNPLSIDAGEWVQDATVAQEFLAFATAQTARAQATLPQVRVKPELNRQIGDIIRLTDGNTDLLSKAIITGIHLTGSHGSYEQRLDLCLLDLTFTDLDNHLSGQAITTFDELDQLLATQGVSTFTEFDDWLRDFGRTL